MTDLIKRLRSLRGATWAEEAAAELERLRAELEAARKDAERLSAALGLIWTIQVRKHTHLGLERWSGFEQDCIACICALALGQAMDQSPTAEEFISRRTAIKATDAAMRVGE